MKKLSQLVFVSIFPVIAIINVAGASCSDGLSEKTWDRTPRGYCKIFFPNCTVNDVGNPVSYFRDVTAPQEVLCVGDQGVYNSYYNVTINEANQVMNTNFSQMGGNYETAFSQWLNENCRRYCDEVEAGAAEQMTREIEE